MTRNADELAKQLGLYGDAVTGFSVAQALAFALALGSSNEFRNSLLQGWFFVILLTLLFLAFYFYLLNQCHSGEDALLGKPNGNQEVDYWTRRIRHIRLFIVVSATAFALIAFGATAIGEKIVQKSTRAPAPAVDPKRRVVQQGRAL